MNASLDLVVDHLCPPLEHDRLVARSFAISKGRHCFCGLVLEACQHFVQILRTELFEEPFSGGEHRKSGNIVLEARRIFIHVGSWQFSHCSETKACILGQDWTSNLGYI